MTEKPQSGPNPAHQRTLTHNDTRVIYPDGTSYMIIEEQQAMYPTDNTVVEGLRGKLITTVRELLLSNEESAFRCVHPLGDGCRYVAGTLRSVTAHQRSHSAMLKLKNVNTELTEIKKKQEASRQRRSAGIRRGREERAKRLENGGAPSDDDRPVIQHLSRSWEVLDECRKSLTEAQRQYDNAFAAYLQSVDKVVQSSTTDPMIAKKAQNWDKYIEFQAMLKDNS